MRRPLSVAAVAILLVSGCTQPSAPAGSPDSVPASTAAIPTCESIALISPPESAFRDTPIYVGDEMPAERIGEWARTKPGFETMWIDRAHAGWVVVAFSSDVAERQAELTEAFPDAGAVAIEVDWRMADLERLQQRVADELRGRFDSFAVGTDVMRGKVTIGLGVLTPDRVDAVRTLFGGERVCVEGLDPSQAIPEGPQPTSGDGWRLLAKERAGEPFRTGIAADQQTYEALWDRIGLTSAPPPVDFNDEVVIWLGAVYGSSCPDIRLDDLVSDVDRKLVHGTIVQPSTYVFCTADANPQAFVLALERAKLPPPPFVIQLSAADPPGGAPEERTIVEADLRIPGSVPRTGDVHADPDLPKPEVIEPGSIIETGFENPFRFDVSCGIQWLGPLNSYWWEVDLENGADASVPGEWEPFIEGGSLTVTVMIETDPEPTLTASAGGRAILYRPVRSARPTCP